MAPRVIIAAINPSIPPIARKMKGIGCVQVVTER